MLRRPLPLNPDQIRKKKAAMMMATSAYISVEHDHKKKSKRIKHTADAFVREKWRYEKKSTLAKGSVTLGVLALSVGLTVGTAGIGLGVMAAIAAGSYTVKKIMGEIQRHKRNKRLLGYMTRQREGQKLTDDKQVNLATEDACAGIVKSVVHLRIAKGLYEEFENFKRKKEAGLIDFDTCEDALFPVELTMNFIHHYDKGRGYLIPCIMLCNYIMEKYKAFSDKWSEEFEAFENVISTNLDAIAKHYGGPKFLDIYIRYESRFLTRSGLPSNFGTEVFSNYSGDGAFGKKSAKTVDIDEVMDGLSAVAKDAFKSYRLNRRPQPMRPRHASGLTDWLVFGEHRYTQMKQDLLKKYDHPGFWTKVHHRMKNWNLATTRSKKFASALGELLDLGAAFAGAYVGAGFGANPNTGKFASKSVEWSARSTQWSIKTGFKGINETSSWVSFRYGAKGTMMETNLLTAQSVHATNASEKELKEAAQVVSGKMFKKISHHFKKAKAALKKLNASHRIGGFDDLFAYAKKLYEVHHHFDKMERYLMTGVTMIMLSLKLSEELGQELKVMRKFLETDVKPFVMGGPGEHKKCRAKKKNRCYGPKCFPNRGPDWRSPHKRA